MQSLVGTEVDRRAVGAEVGGIDDERVASKGEWVQRSHVYGHDVAMVSTSQSSTTEEQ